MFHVLELLRYVRTFNLSTCTIFQMKYGMTTTFQLTRLTIHQTCFLMCWLSYSINMEVLVQRKCSEIPPEDSLVKSSLNFCVSMAPLWHMEVLKLTSRIYDKARFSFKLDTILWVNSSRIEIQLCDVEAKRLWVLWVRYYRLILCEPCCGTFATRISFLRKQSTCYGTRA